MVVDAGIHADADADPPAVDVDRGCAFPRREPPRLVPTEVRLAVDDLRPAGVDTQRCDVLADSALDRSPDECDRAGLRTRLRDRGQHRAADGDRCRIELVAGQRQLGKDDQAGVDAPDGRGVLERVRTNIPGVAARLRDGDR